MDYEQKYKDALDAAKHIYDNMKSGGNFGGMEDLEVIFPELRESEDERALRIIKKRMCYDPVPISDEDRRIVENWLEKQKEQKPAEKQDDLETADLLAIAHLQGMEQQKGNIKNLLKSWAENELDEHPNKNDDFRLAIYSLMDKLNDL